jgi:hypothetical protein
MPKFNRLKLAMTTHNREDWIGLNNLIEVEEVVSMGFKAPRFFKLAYL